MSGTRSGSTRAPATEDLVAGARLAGAALVVCSYASGAWAGKERLRFLARTSGAAEIAAATLFGAPRIEDVVAGLRASPVFVVPLFMCRGVTYGALRDRLARLPGSDRVVLCPELGSHPGLAGRVAAHAERALHELGWRARETSLLLIGHGSRRNAASGRATARLASEVGKQGGFADTAAAYLEESPTIEEAVRACAGARVFAIGCFAEAGRHATEDVPRSLRQCGRATAYSGPIGACDWVDALVLDQAVAGLQRAALARAPAWGRG